MFDELQARNTEITEALRREEAGSEILRLISNSPEDLAPTLQAIATAAQRLTGMTSGLLLFEGAQLIIRGLATTPGDAITGELGSHHSRTCRPFSRSLAGREARVQNWDTYPTRNESCSRPPVSVPAHGRRSCGAMCCSAW